MVTVDIITELRNTDLEIPTPFKDVEILLGIEYINKTINGEKMRVLEGHFEKLTPFLESEIKIFVFFTKLFNLEYSFLLSNIMLVFV